MSKYIVVSDLGPVRLKTRFKLKLGVPAPFSESDELAQPNTKSWIFREVPGSVLRVLSLFSKRRYVPQKGTPLDVFHWFLGPLLFLP